MLAVDGNSLLHRAFHARAHTGFHLPDGRPAWAVRGLLSQLAAAVDRSCAAAVVVGFDDPVESVRRRRWPHYKAQRDAKLETIVAQLGLAAEVLNDLGIVVVVPEGLEADDVLASVARHAPTLGAQTVIATSDRDSFALIDDNTRVLRILNGGVEASPMLDPHRLHLLTGVWPHQYRDLAALRGDASDNLPGVRGIGARKGAQLLAEFGTVEAALADAMAEGQRCRTVVGKAVAATLASETARQAWAGNVEIMTMHHDLPIALAGTGPGWLPLDESAVRQVFARFDLFLPTGLRALCGLEVAPVAPRDIDPSWRPWTPRSTARFPPLRPAPAPKVLQDTLF